MNNPDEIRVSADQNPAMMDYLSSKNPGDKCLVEGRLTLKSMDSKGAVFTVDALIPEGYEEAPDGDESATASAPKPPPQDAIPTMAAGMVRKKMP